jgi:nitroreductase
MEEMEGHMKSILDVIVSRRSVRKWKADAVSDGDIKDILEAAMNAPSAVNEQAWQFLVLTGKILEDFVKINANTPKGSPVGILVCGDKKLDKLGGFYVHDCCAATQNILLAVHAKGLGGVWTAIFPNAIPEVRRLLNLPEHVHPLAFVPFGYPVSERTKPTSRYDETKVHRNGW